MRLVIICEGDTEYKILGSFLSPYLTEFEDVEINNTKGVGKLKREFREFAELALSEAEDTYVFCLFDLLEAPFPLSKDANHADDPTDAKYRELKSHLEGLVDEELRARFFAFPIVQEIEAWILADIAATKTYFRTSTIKNYAAPESVKHPADELKILLQRFRQREYRKTDDGIELFKLIDAKRVYDDNCPHFNELVDQLLEIQGLKPRVEEIPPLWKQKDQRRMALISELQEIRETPYDTDEELDRLVEKEAKIEQALRDLDS